MRAGSDKRPQLHRVRAVVGRVGGALRRSVHTWSGLQSNGSRGRARVGWEVGESTRGGVPKDVGAGGVREGVRRAAGGRDPDGTGGVGRTGTGLAGPGRIGLQMAPGVGGRRAAVGWLGGCRAEVGMDGCRAAG